ncbi:MAG: hypothetical protein GNW80_02700 [Asgard group archaeon]|nr:hypothetical protein [Asgard group archaeon]
MEVGASFNRIHKIRKQSIVYLILLVIVIPVFTHKQEFTTDSIPNTKDERLYETAQSSVLANFSIINNDFNIFYKDIIIKDDLAIINNKFSIIIYNITKPEEPKKLSESIKCISEILKMEVDGDTLFIGFNFDLSTSYMTKIQVYNISDPTIIEPTGCFLYYNFQDFVIEDGFGYIATIRNRMLIINVQDPTNMHIVGELGGFSSISYNIDVEGNCSILYANEYFDPVLFVDVSDKENPILAYIGLNYYEIVDAKIYDDTLFLLSSSSFISVNISDIYSPQYLVSYSIMYTSTFYNNEGYVYIEDNFRILILDVRDPSDFDFIAYYNFNDLNAPYVSSMDFFENYTLFTCGTGGISVYNTTGFTSFSKIYQSGLDGGKEIEYENGLCYILENNRLDVINASNLSNLTVISSYEVDYTTDMQIDNNRAYILTVDRIEILNISNPMNITKLGEINVDNPMAFSVHNDFVAVVGNSLYLFDVTLPHAASLLDSIFVTTAYINALEMTNETIMMTDFGDVIILFDYSNPFNIQLINTVHTFSYYSIERFFLYENYLFGVSSYEEVIVVLNITDIPTASYFLIEDFNYDINDIFVENDLMYVASSFSAATVYNISNLHNIVLFSEIDLLSQPILETGYRLDVENNTIFLLNEEGALQIVGLDSDDDYLANYLEEKTYFTTTGSQDSDSDFIFDGYEIHHGLNPLNAGDASEDFDNDNLTNLEEFQYFSNPKLSDSDFDCVLDEKEITIYNTNITSPDTDFDLLIDGFEIYVSLTDPLGNDSDADLLLDGEEVLIYSTDPQKNDTDSDSMDDYFEIYYSLNPLDPSDRYLDLDMDGLLNFEEYQYNTRPDCADSDFDFYSDLEEIENGTDPLDPSDFPDYPKIFTTSFAGYEELSVFISTIFVLGFITIIIRLRRNRGARID